MSASGYFQVNLASDLPGLAHATVPSLVNPWGIAYSPTGPFWFADTGAGVSNLLDGRGQVVPLVATIPGAGGAHGSPTGTVLNSGPGFAVSANGLTGSSTFLFATIDGAISGWTEDVNSSDAVIAVDNSSEHAMYTGLALATSGSGRSYLYAANISLGRVDVFDENFHPVQNPSAFQDPNLPAGYSPFNVQNIDGRLFVTYVNLNGFNAGVVDIYNTDGTLLNRFASQGMLNAPWGVTQTPADFGRFGGAILIGNNGDGRINAYSPTGAFLGQLADGSGQPIAISGLWALTFGNGYAGGNADTLFFAAGYDNGNHGLFGAIQPPQLAGADTGGDEPFDPYAPGEPHNYPLPPVQAPPLQNADTVTRPVSVLLPASCSSLSLIPTLATDISRPQPGTPPRVLHSRLVAASLEGPGATVARLAAQEASDASRPENTITLNSLLDLNSAPYAQANPVVRPRVFREVDSSVRPPTRDDDPSLFAEIILGEQRSEYSESPVISAAAMLEESALAQEGGQSIGVNGVGTSWTRIFGGLLGVIAIHAAADNLPITGRRASDRPRSSRAAG